MGEICHTFLVSGGYMKHVTDRHGQAHNMFSACATAQRTPKKGAFRALLYVHNLQWFHIAKKH
jgi:hypothetical protein